MKKCSKCGEEKSPEEFNKRGDKVDYYCTKCRKEYSKSHYISNKDLYIERSKKTLMNTKRHYLKYKESLCCTDCGMSFKGQAYLCDLHHVEDDKEAVVSALLRHGIKKVMKEADKCIPLCANCHRRRHYLESS